MLFSYRKTVFFLCKQETQSSPSEGLGGCVAVLAVCRTDLMQHKGEPPQMAWQKQSWIAASGGLLENRRAVAETLPWKSPSPRMMVGGGLI